MKTLTCREHGGTFQVVPARGRPPTRCGGKWSVCSRYPEGRMVDPAPTHTSKLDRSSRRAPDEERIRQAEGTLFMPAKRLEGGLANPSLAPAMAARDRLQPLGWTCNGRAWLEDHHAFASLIATRDEELIVMHWNDGQLIRQDYELWHEQPSANGKPRGSLTFDPDECTDRELIQALSGMKVTWWNVLGQKEETAVVDQTRIEIVHAYNGMGDETPGDRIIKFSDHAGTGFRAFRVGALLKVG